MSNDMPNAPMSGSPMPPAGAPTSMFQTWVNALTKPSEATFAEIARSPSATSTNAFIWVFIASLIQSFLTFLVQGQVMRRMLEQAGQGQNLPTGGLAGTAFSVICGAPIAAVATVFFFAIGVGLIQWVARMFGGRGTYNQLAYTFAAVLAPFSIISGVLALLSAIPYVGACFGIVVSLLGIYVLFLEITATKAVNGFGYGQAAGSVLIPGLVIFLVCCCLLFGLLTLIGASVGNVFSQLGPMPFPIPTP